MTTPKTAQEECIICDNEGWVCENHPELPWEGTSVRFDACACGGAGMPCKHCNEDGLQKNGMSVVWLAKEQS